MLLLYRSGKKYLSPGPDILLVSWTKPLPFAALDVLIASPAPCAGMYMVMQYCRWGVVLFTRLRFLLCIIRILNKNLHIKLITPTVSLPHEYKICCCCIEWRIFPLKFNCYAAAAAREKRCVPYEDAAGDMRYVFLLIDLLLLEMRDFSPFVTHCMTGLHTFLGLSLTKLPR